MDLSIITVTWNSEDKIAEQMRSVALGCKDISFEQIVIDNDSADKTAQIISREFPNIKLIENKENRGFGAANNQGVEIAQGEFVLFLNPDMKVSEGSLGKIVAWMRERAYVGNASCKLVDENGNFNMDAAPRRFPGLIDQLAIILKIPHLIPKVLNRYLFRDFNPEVAQEVDSVRGAFMLVRSDILQKLGRGFDPRYHIWFEDVDLCREVKQLGFKVMYTPIISCVDHVGTSFEKRGKYSYWKQKNFTKSMLRYFQKWEPWWKWIWIAGARPFGLIMAWFAETLVSPTMRGSERGSAPQETPPNLPS